MPHTIFASQKFLEYDAVISNKRVEVHLSLNERIYVVKANSEETAAYRKWETGGFTEGTHSVFGARGIARY